MDTTFLLLYRFKKPVIELSEICDEFFGIKIQTAKQRAEAQRLPVPTFRLTAKNSSPWLVAVDDLAAHIDNQQKKARNEWDAVRGFVS
ncbi:MAG: pyocin activator PrtN family protein [Psychromonas sp.]